LAHQLKPHHARQDLPQVSRGAAMRRDSAVVVTNAWGQTEEVVSLSGFAKSGVFIEGA
jgi:hypothetical protein